MFKSLFKSKNKEDAFWDWFASRSNSHFDFEKNQEKLFNELNTRLNRVDKGLTFEFSPILGSGKREFIVPADGIKSVFPAVIELVKKAPVLDNWDIIAFRQPKAGYEDLNYKDIKLSFNDVYFRYSKDNGKIGVELNIRGFEVNNDWAVASFLLLDMVLGEYDTEMGLSWIERKPLDESEINTLYPVSYLPTIIKDYKSEFNN